ncbi:MAG: DUF397 domain-containing protein [Saccharopolyspora sp.]|uniref:DUF397 domain-containing protein n=1 Tax=Saccharopolyspora TaxID=1835 RepID=UPI00190D90C7|nr:MULTISPECIES: DUF397 domain-containing protein [unclassified Saccharopolyspora]MBK0866819.1 DUF397 domain-containing protein [Saccharopolyspora sp. HNM0986]MBQ6641976.1 DUF397 domain-containing protein [Saccharopolyspora sp.]
MQSHRELGDARWRKSGHSASNPHCVEVAVTADGVGVRDTKDRSGGVLSFSSQHWRDFLTALKGD